MAYFKRLELPKSGIYLYESVHPKGEKVYDHYHDQYQILYALDGEGEIYIDNEKYLFCKDSVVFLVPNTIHSIVSSSKLTDLVLAFSTESLGSFAEKGLIDMFENTSRYFELDFVSASEIRQLFRKMLFEQTGYDELSEYTSSIHLLEMITIFARLINSRQSFDANDMRAIQMKEYIEKHYFEEITSENLSSKFNISTRYVNDIFKSKFHETPLQYLQKVRINRAKELLQETNKEIVSICFEVGYETLSTFYRSFRNLVGISPHKFRTMNQELLSEHLK